MEHFVLETASHFIGSFGGLLLAIYIAEKYDIGR